jgi:hypothetical protein
LIFSEVPDDPSGELAVDLAGDLADELAEVSAVDLTGPPHARIEPTGYMALSQIRRSPLHGGV